MTPIAQFRHLRELGVIGLPSLTEKIRGADLPDRDNPYRRSLVLGSTMGAGMGMGCPMPTYYILLGWVAAAAYPLYGAIVLGDTAWVECCRRLGWGPWSSLEWSGRRSRRA